DHPEGDDGWVAAVGSALIPAPRTRVRTQQTTGVRQLYSFALCKPRSRRGSDGDFAAAQVQAASPRQRDPEAGQRVFRPSGARHRPKSRGRSWTTPESVRGRADLRSFAAPPEHRRHAARRYTARMSRTSTNFRRTAWL